jgi:hypothetical protein
MTAEQLFSIVNTVALVSWLTLALLPRVRWVSHALTAVWVPLLFSVVYLALIAANFRGSSGGFSTLAGVAQLFSNPWLLLAGWVHYLAFDLFVGSWEVRDAQARGISHWLVVPCLALTFFFGPIGFLACRALALTKPT